MVEIKDEKPVAESRLTYGYRKGEAKIFDLKPGEELPSGWSDTPPVGEHPNVPRVTSVPPPWDPMKDDPPPGEADPPRGAVHGYKPKKR